MARLSSDAAAALGGPLLPRTPAEGLRNGTVPVLSGHTRDEARVNAGTAALLGTPITDAEYPALIEQGFGDRAPAVLESSSSSPDLITSRGSRAG